MLPSINSYSILYTLFAWILGMCYGFVLLSSAAGQNGETRLFETGQSFTYKLHSTVLLNERGDSSKNVGYYIDGDVVVQVIWGDGSKKLLKIQLKSPQLHIKSRKAPSPDGFIPHSSKLDSFKNKPFLIVWNRGKIEEILLPKGETVSMANLKKGIASLFQFQLLDGESPETDASGHCTATYTSLSPNKISKAKTNCLNNDFRYIRNPDEILGCKTDSLRQTEYELDSSNTYFKVIRAIETHEIYLLARTELGNYVKTEQILTFVNAEKIEQTQVNDIKGALEKIGASEGVTYTHDSLLTEREATEDAPSFSIQVDGVRDLLKTENFGTLKPAKAFLRLIEVARKANVKDILKVLESKKNKLILPQIYDIMGYAQTKDSHQAVMKKLHFDKEEQIEESERYLWALSFSSQPNPEIIRDLLNKYTKTINIPDKVKETLILTIASMTHRLKKLSEAQNNAKLIKTVEETILNNLEYAKKEDRFVFFRALKNLHSESTIPLLLHIIKKGTQKEGVLAWKAIKSFNPKLWTNDVLKVAEKSFFQLDRKYDTSSRTLAADILIESQPDDQLLKDFFDFLISNDPNFEIKQYIFQRIMMAADEDPIFRGRVQRIVKNNDRINNYSGLTPRGLSVALTRPFLRDTSCNGSLVSVQEMNTGIVKRGIVDVVMNRDGISKELFSLGIFSGGLHSFMSSDVQAEEEEEEEVVTAGMELTVIGTQLRPFVFFNSQGELMGHVWSGTASEKTPALQILVLLQDHMEYLRLGSGFVAEMQIKGATSFDLSGKIEISLWNRNAESYVEKSAGIVIIGSTAIDSSFVKSEVEFSASIEPKLNLQTDIDFSSNINLCMRLTQPESIFRHNIFKIERIPGSKHKLRISKYKKSTVPGTTYSINKKNNEMCRAIFS